jgi:hypothetical protein
MDELAFNACFGGDPSGCYRRVAFRLHDVFSSVEDQ